MPINNKKIVQNTVIMYLRLIITSIVGLFVIRLLLKALGIEDYGIYSVVGGIVSIAGIINTIMLAASNRYITYALGQGDENNFNKTFNVTLLIHIFIAFFVLVTALPIGEWYINQYLVLPEGSLFKGIWIYRISLFGALFSFIGVPYQGLMMADEKFFAFCFRDVIVSILKLLIVILLFKYSGDRLILYAILLSVITIFQQIWNYVYCKATYGNQIQFKIIKEITKYREILNFSLWTGYGAIASVGKSQGAALIINRFFGVALNSALGIANSMNSIVMMFSSSLASSMSPQITKNYASGDIDSSIELVERSSRYSFMLMIAIVAPLWVSLDSILNIWLGNVPDYTEIIIKLMFIDSLVLMINSGIATLVFATGRIKWYQFVVNTAVLLSLPLAYFTLTVETKPEMLYYSYIAISIVTLIVRQVVLSKEVRIDITSMFKNAYLPIVYVSVLVTPILLYMPHWNPIIKMVIAFIYTSIVVWSIGLKTLERNMIIATFHSKLKAYKNI